MHGKKLLLTASLTLWTGAVLIGFGWLHAYHNQPGDEGQVPTGWPATCPFPLDRERCTLVIALHNQCPCSRTSVGQLGEILARCAGALRVHVIVYEPAGLAGIDLSDLAQHAGVQFHPDPDGSLAQSFGLRTSGHALLFDGQGRRLFSGGLTRGRGLEGPSSGQEAILCCVLASRESPTSANVFGCPLPSNREVCHE